MKQYNIENKRLTVFLFQSRSWALEAFAKSQPLSQPPIPGISDDSNNAEGKMDVSPTDHQDDISQILGIIDPDMMCLPTLDIDSNIDLQPEDIVKIADMDSSMLSLDKTRNDEFSLDSPLDSIGKPETPDIVSLTTISKRSSTRKSRSPRTPHHKSSGNTSTTIQSPASSRRGRTTGKSPVSLGSIRSPRSVGSSIKSPSSDPQSVGSVKSPVTPKDSIAIRSNYTLNQSTSGKKTSSSSTMSSSTSSKVDVKSSPKISVSNPSGLKYSKERLSSKDAQPRKPADCKPRHNSHHTSSTSNDTSPTKTPIDNIPKTTSSTYRRAARKSPKSKLTVSSSSSDISSDSDSDDQDSLYEHNFHEKIQRRTVKSESMDRTDPYRCIKSDKSEATISATRKPPIVRRLERPPKDRTKTSTVSETTPKDRTKTSTVSETSSTTTVTTTHPCGKHAETTRKSSSSVENLDSSVNMERFLEDIQSPTEQVLSPIANDSHSSSSSGSDMGSDSGSDCGSGSDSGSSSDSDINDMNNEEHVDVISPIRTPPQQLSRSPRSTQHKSITTQSALSPMPSPPHMPISTVIPAVSVATSTTAPTVHRDKLIVSIPLNLIPEHLLKKLNHNSSIPHPHLFHPKHLPLGLLSASLAEGQSGNVHQTYASPLLEEDEEGEINSDSDEENVDGGNPSVSGVLPPESVADRIETPPPQANTIPKNWKKGNAILSHIIGTDQQLSKQMKIPKRKPGQLSPRRQENKRQRMNSGNRSERRSRYDRE